LTPSLSDAKFKHQGLMEKSDHVESSPTLPQVKFDCKKTIPTHLIIPQIHSCFPLIFNSSLLFSLLQKRNCGNRVWVW